ncbi:MAG TPA: hypothetical protein VNN79_22605 [Actinomycetota bacterium]|nr:hypothetical protein [Actinomycetota bacterium]
MGAIVVVSIIGCDKFTGGYGRAKVVHERVAVEGPVPTVILRASQFHEFVGQLLDWGTRDGGATLSAMRMQPVAARAVGEALADLAVEPGEPGTIGEIAGPREERLAGLARLLVARRGAAIRIEEGADPNDPYASLYESDALLPGPGALLAGPTFEEWLDAAYPVPSGAAR